MTVHSRQTAGAFCRLFAKQDASTPIDIPIYGQLTVGEDDVGYDVTLYGATSGSKFLWDESNNRLEFTQARMSFGTLSSSTAGSGVTLDADVTRILEVHADDKDTARATGTMGRAIFGRTMIYKDNACEDWGVDGLSKISAVAKTGNVSAGVVGRFESTGTCTTATGSGNTFVAGVMGRLGLGASFTIGSGTWACGVLSFYNISTTNNPATGYTCAFMSTASDIAGTGDWDYGLYLEDCTMGISFDGVSPPADAGNYGSTLNCTWLGIDPGSGGSFGAKLMFSNTDTSGYCLYGLGLRCKTAAATAIAVGLNVSGSAGVASSGYVHGGQFYLQNSGLLTIAGTAPSTALYCKSWLDAACSPSASALWIDDESDTKATTQYMVDITMNGTIELDDVFHIYGGDPGADTFIDFDLCDQGTGAFVLATASGGGTRSHRIKCKVNGSTVGYLSLYTT